MKTFFLTGFVVLALAAGLTLSGCDNNKDTAGKDNKEPSTQDILDVLYVRDNLTLPRIIRNNLTLPYTTEGYDTLITWASSNTAVITKNGQVTRPAKGEGNAAVTLTATIKKNYYSETIDFQVIVLDMDDLVHHYPFSENANDIISACNGILMGDAAIEDNSLVLDGTDSCYVNMPPGWLKEADEITIELWAKPVKFQYWQSFFEISTDNASETNRQWLTFSMSGDPYSSAKGPILKGKAVGSNEYTLSADASKTLPLNQWAHLAATFRNGRGQIYINGEVAVADTADNRFPFSKIFDLGETQNNWIGKTIQNKYWGNPNFRGSIMDYKIYYRVLTAQEISAKSKNLQLVLAMQGISLGNTEWVTENLTLPASGPFGSTVSWSSNKTQFVTNAGMVTLPETSGEDVTLTATLTLNGQSDTKTFSLHIPSALECDRIFIENYPDYILNSEITVLPATAKYGSVVSWQIVSGNLRIDGNKVYKTVNAQEKEPVKLKATVSRSGSSQTIEFNNLTLMDPFAAFILAYFDDDTGGGSSSMRMAYGFNGKDWSSLNGITPVLKAATGTKFMRDPFILRMRGGGMMPICTQGWSTPQIYFWDSNGLTDFTNERLVKVSETGVEGLKGDKAWAPEASYDPIKDIYYIYWSDSGANNGDSPIYYNTTSDFITVSAPSVYFDGGRQIIDASIFKHEAAYYLTYKDETGPGKDIWVAKSDSLDPGSFKIISDGPVTPRPVEGPFIFKSLTEPYTFFMYYDFFETPSGNRLAYSSISDITKAGDKTAWTHVPLSDVTMPSGIKASHGGVITVTYKELERIRKAWNTSGSAAERNFSDLTMLIETANNELKTSAEFTAALNTAKGLSSSSTAPTILSAFNALFSAIEDLYKEFL